MTPQVTQCPKCHTSFRVTEAQLTIANGAVRCGSCLHIFDAPDHWLHSDPTPTLQPDTDLNPIIEAPDDTPTTDLFNDSGEHRALDTIFDDAIFSDDKLDPLVDELATETAKDPQAATDNDIDTSNFVFDSNLGDEPAVVDNHSSEQIIGDDPFALDTQTPDTLPRDTLPRDTSTRDSDLNDDDAKLIDDDMPLDDEKRFSDTAALPVIDDTEPLLDDDEIDTEPDFSSDLLELDIEEEEASTVFKDLDDIGEDSVTEEDAWAKKLLEDDDTEEPSSHSEAADEFSDIFDNLEEPATRHHEPELQDILEQQDQAYRQEPVAEDEFILGDETLVAGQRIGDDKHALLANIEPEPVEISSTRRGNQWIQRAWIASIIAAAVLLAAQYVLFNFDSISRDARYRPLLASVCSTLGCQLPAPNDIRLIRSSNLMVRSHPDTGGALVVDAIISNRANFKQQFPIMELQFTDLSGEIVAGRQFKPEEYLAGELLGSSLMPVKQPVHISLAIVDPGEQAVNYQLRFH